MRKAPELAERIIVCNFTQPAFTAPAIAVNGYDEEREAFSVKLAVPFDVPTYEPFGHERPYLSTRSSKELGVDALVRQQIDGTWIVVDPGKPLPRRASQ